LVEDYQRRQKEMEPLEEQIRIGSLKAVKVRSFGWDDFDRIYQIAATSFVTLRACLPGTESA
jgi:hypothetical protein